MAIEIRVPHLGESISEATVGKWFKKAGDTVAADEPVCELETDKVTVEVGAPIDGVLGNITAAEGETVAIGAVLGSIREGSGKAAAAPTAAATVAAAAIAKPAAPVAAMPPAPSARKLMTENGIDAGQVSGSGRRGQILKEDVTAAIATVAGRGSPAAAAAAAPAKAQEASYATLAPLAHAPVPAQQMRTPVVANDGAREERVKLTRLRQTIARRLKDAQNTAAMLTTFNDVDMGAVMKARADYKDAFEKRHGVRLGFMGFFVKSCIQALKEVPAVNAEIDGQDLIYKNYYHVSVAVSTEKGLVVPVIRDADQLSIAGVEAKIADFGKRARDGKLTIEDMQGGTFSITNGGVFGSLVSTPILNAPQSGILGMHRIEERPVVRNGQIVARPMMYLALTYDHRIVDGREAVSFLVRVKECLEDPQRLLLDM